MRRFALSTSGQSERDARAVLATKRAGATVLGMTGAADWPVATRGDTNVRVPWFVIPFIQEAHIAIGHAICGVVEAAVAPAGMGAP